MDDLEIIDEATGQRFKLSRNQGLALAGAGAFTLVSLASQPVLAQTAESGFASAVTDMKDMMTALGGLAETGLAIALVPLGIRVGLRITWHVLASA